MAKQPTAWSKIVKTAGSWFSKTLQFAQYNNGFTYNSGRPYNMQIDNKPAAWSPQSKTPTGWSKA